MKIKTIGIWLLSLIGLIGAPLEIGAKVPELQVTTHDGKVAKLESAKGDNYLFVFFFPKALTGG